MFEYFSASPRDPSRLPWNRNVRDNSQPPTQGDLQVAWDTALEQTWLKFLFVLAAQAFKCIVVDIACISVD
jgi:hypothetical protein